MHSTGFKYGPVTDPCKHGNESWDSMKGGEFLEQVSDYKLVNKDSTPWS
jgi:hypothetical protein